MIQLVEVVEKKVPVKAVLGKEPRHPYRLDEASGLVVEPGQVIARGPRRNVSQMPWLRTEFLDLQEETAGGEKERGAGEGGSAHPIPPREGQGPLQDPRAGGRLTRTALDLAANRNRVQ